MSARLPFRPIAVFAFLIFLANPSTLFAAYTSTVSGSTAIMIGDASGDILVIADAGGTFIHNRFGLDPNFNSAQDFDTTVPGDQTVSSASGIININAGDGNDTIVLGNGINLRGGIDGGIGTDTLDYSAFTTPVSANLGLNTTQLKAVIGADQENPETTHPGTGTATVTNYNIDTHTFDIVVTVTDLPPGDVIGFHIHQEKVGSNGPIIVDFTGVAPLTPVGTGFTFNATGLTLPSISEAAFLGGGTYVNIHTPTFPGGAIRGQLFSQGNAATVNGEATGATVIANIENVTGGLGADSLVGNSGANTINGGGGPDWIVGAAEADTLNGDAGADVLVWSNGDGADIDEGGADGDVVYVTGSPISGEVLLVSANGTRLRFDRTSPAPFTLDIGTTETLIVNSTAGAATFTVNNLAGVAAITAVNLNGFGDGDIFNVRPFAAGTVSVRGGTGSDTLNYDAQSQTVTGDTTPPDGSITSPGMMAVPFIQTETITIVNPQPSILINDVTVTEPGSAMFNVTLTNPSVFTVTVNFATADGTATQPGDYTSQSGMLTFVAGDVSEPITVPVIGDGIVEPSETFFVNLAGAVNAAIADTQGQGTITNNAAPTISDIANQTIAEDTATSALPFTINDAETPGTLTVSASSSNLTLVPASNIALGGSGGSRTVMVTPAADQSGTAIITVTVSDGLSTTDDTFTVTVNPVNDPPTITNIADQTIAANSATAALPFTIGDIETAPASLLVSGGSSNPALVPIGNIVFGGAGANRTVTVMPAADQSGVAIITVTVSDGVASANDTFTLTVTAPPEPPAPPPPPPPPPPPNQAPTINGVADATIEESAAHTMALTIGDDTTPPANLIVTATSSNAALLPASGVVLGGSGAARTLTLTPVAEANGQTTITVTVSDGELTTTATAVLTVRPVRPPNPPTGLTATASGTEVTLNWIEPAAGATPTFYVIEGGIGPGLTTLPVIATPSRTTRWTLTLPAGVYFFRLRTANRVGTSTASNEASAAVTSPVPLPGAPTGLAAIVDGLHVTLGWERPIGGGAPDGWQLELGTTRGASDRGVFAVAPSVTRVGGDLTAGEYFARVRGINGAGPGPASNEASFRVGDVPACEAPQPPVLLPATVVGRTMTLSWQAPRGTAVANYRLLGGSTPGGSDLAIFDVGPVTSFVVQAGPGRYYATLLATNTCGTSTPSNSIEVIVQSTDAPPAPANLRGTVNGSMVTFAWDVVAGATSYVLEAGSASGLSDVASLPVVGTGLSLSGVPRGTHYVRVRAVRAGVPSVPSAEIVIVVP